MLDTAETMSVEENEGEATIKIIDPMQKNKPIIWRNV